MGIGENIISPTTWVPYLPSVFDDGRGLFQALDRNAVLGRDVVSFCFPHIDLNIPASACTNTDTPSSPTQRGTLWGTHEHEMMINDIPDGVARS